jgi:hypothetical protein
MTEPTGAAPLVLLTTDDPQQCAEALIHLLPTLPPEWSLAVVAHGLQALDCQQVAQEMLRRHPFGSVGVSTGNRLDAVNEGLRYMLPGCPALYLLTDDARVVEGWLHGLGQTLVPTVVHGLGERVLEGCSGFGIVAPCTDQAHSPAQRLALTADESSMGLAAYAAARLGAFVGHASLADYVDGFCLLITGAVVEACSTVAVQKSRTVGATDLALAAAKTGPRQLVDPALGQWAWADLCLRAGDLGYRVAVSEAVFVGRTTTIPLGHPEPGNVQERLAFYDQHTRHEDEVIVAAVTVPTMHWQVVQTLRMNLRRLAPVADKVVLVLQSADVGPLSGDQEFSAAERQGRLPEADKRLAAQRRDPVAAVAAWAYAAVADTPNCRLAPGDFVVVEAEDPAPHSCRTQALREAHERHATGVLAMDYDEMLGAGLHREHLHAWLQHPNPLVRGYDCSVAYHWDAATLVREDAPWGHGGTYQGGQHGVRLLRVRAAQRRLQEVLPGPGAGYLPDMGPGAQRVAACTMRRFRFARRVDRTRLEHSIGHEEGMRLSAYTGDNRMGLHVLLYEAEEPEDLARWLDDVHCLVDRVVLVWTGEWAESDKGWAEGHMEPGQFWPETGPSAIMAQVAELHRCEWVHQPLNDDLAAARNAGIHVLHQHGLRWAWFIDPDEWLPDPLGNCAALRNMTTSDRWGWMMQVANYRADKKAPTISDSVRISRLDPACLMRMNGRVHEGFSKAIATLTDQGIHPRLRYAPFVVQHRGMAFDQATMEAKLDKYDRLLRLELEDDPHSPGAWVSLGWQYMNDGHEAEGLECYRRALTCAGRSYLPFKELAYHHLRQARVLLDECDARLENSHQFHRLLQAMREWLATYAPDAPVLERREQRNPLPLPEWEPPDSANGSG